MKQGQIVFLNGTSSAGKTSISMELINQEEILYHLSIDDFFHNFNDLINNKFPDLKPVKALDDVVIGQIMFEPIISPQLNCF